MNAVLLNRQKTLYIVGQEKRPRPGRFRSLSEAISQNLVLF